MIKVTIHKKRYDIEVSGDSIKEVLEKVAFFDELPNVCPVDGCKQPVRFAVRKPDDFSYYGMICAAGHETTFGVYQKDSRELYYKPHEPWRKFDPNAPRE